MHQIVGKVWLRNIALSDCTQRYVNWLNDPDLMRYLESRHEPVTMESNRTYIHACMVDPNVRLWAIISNEDQMHVGNIKLGPINKRHSIADIGYFIGEKDRWGKGYATCAIEMATNFAFTELKLRMVRAGFYEANLASRYALVKAGYDYVGQVDGEMLLDGKPHNHVFYAKTNPEWKPS
jgi:[ribosomal protein S5]-alanine N-acetyltransferase